MDLPKVSICIPTYNRQHFLREALESALAQSYSNLEIIISDDASPINQSTVIETFKDPRIKFFRQNRNLGFIENWNFCISKSSGDYVKIMGDDDRLLPFCIEKEITQLLKNETDFICSNYETIDGNSSLINNDYFNIESFRLLNQSGFINEKDFLTRYFLGDLRIGLPTAIMFKKSLIDKVGWFDRDIGCPADIDMWIRFMEKTNLYYQDDVLLQLRWHNNNLSKKMENDTSTPKNNLSILYRNFKKVKNYTSLKRKILIFSKYSKLILSGIIYRPKITFRHIRPAVVELSILFKCVF